MNEIKHPSVGYWLYNAREQGRQGHLLQSLDDPKRRILGLLDRDTDTFHYLGLTAVKDRANWGASLPDPFEQILTGLDLTEPLLADLIRSPEGRATVARLVSGRAPRPEEIPVGFLQEG